MSPPACDFSQMSLAELAQRYAFTTTQVEQARKSVANAEAEIAGMRERIARNEQDSTVLFAQMQLRMHGCLREGP